VINLDAKPVYKPTREHLEDLTLLVGKLFINSGELLDGSAGKRDVSAAIEKIRGAIDITVKKFAIGTDERAKLLKVGTEKLHSIFLKEVIERSAQHTEDLTAKASLSEQIFDIFQLYGLDLDKKQEIARAACKYLVAPIGISLRLDGTSPTSNNAVPLRTILDRAYTITIKAELPEEQAMGSAFGTLGDKVATYKKTDINIEDMLQIQDASLFDILLPKLDL